MGNDNKNIDDAINQFKDTMKDLKNKNMYDDMVDKYQKDKKNKKNSIRSKLDK